MKDKDANEKKKYRSHGDGGLSARKDKNGKVRSYQAYCYYIDQFTGKKERYYESGKTPKEAIGKIRDWEASVRDGQIVPGSVLTLNEWGKIWLEQYAKIRLALSTYEAYQKIFELHLYPHLGTIRLIDLKPHQVQKMINELATQPYRKLGRPLSSRRIEYILAVLHTALRQAVKNGLINRNVCDAIEKPKKSSHEINPWTLEQTKRFLKATKGTRYYYVWHLAGSTGMRRGELLGLKWEDIDFKKGCCYIRRAYIKVARAFIFSDPKTSKSRRMVTLDKQVLAELKAWKAHQGKEALAFPGEYNALNMVFTNELGQPYSPDVISQRFKRDVKSAGVPDQSLHGLRHFHASLLLELDVGLKVVADRLGHSTITLTANTYGHISEETQRKASDKVGTALS